MSEPELLSTLAAASIKSVAILALAGVVTTLWRTSSASARHLVWTIGVAACLLVPALEMVVARLDAPAIRISTWSPTPTETLIERDPATVTTQQIATEPIPKAKPKPEMESSTPIGPVTAHIAMDPLPQQKPLLERTVESVKAGAIYIWLAGCLLALLPIAAAIIRIRLLSRKSSSVTAGRWSDLVARTPALEHLSGRIRIVESTATAMPMTWGILAPTLLVPSGASEWPEWKCRNILLHELAHVERRDCLTQLLAQVACALYWFNPLVWLAAHRMRVERELACDDRVITAGSTASDYASNLLDVARSLRAPSLTSSTAIAMARPSQLSGRLLAVLDATRNRSSVTSRIRAGVSCAAVAVVIPMSFIIPGPGHPVAAPSVSHMRAPARASKIVSSPRQVAEPPAFQAQVPSSSVFVSTSDSKTAAPWPYQQGSPCWASDGKGSTHISSSSNDDGDSRQSFEVRYTRDNCSLEARAEGKFTLRPDLSDVESISNDGWFRVEERIGRESKRVEIRRGSNGSLEHQYWVNGDHAPFNDDARAWLARTLLSIERTTAVAASTRVPQLYRNTGLRGLLAEIAQMQSAYAKSAYYKTFLGMGVSLDANTLNTVVRQASTDLSSSDYYLSEVLSKFASQPAVNEATWRTFAEAAGGMKSDYYRSETLKKVLKGGRLSGQTVGILLNSASGMKSDYYLSELLQAVASQYAVNGDTRQYYVDALRKIDSDYYRGQVLETLSRDGTWDAKTSNFVLASVGEMKSEYYRAEALKSLIKANHVTDWATFFNSTSAIPSDYYKRDVLSTALRQTPLSRDVVAGVLSVATRMKSDNDISEVLAEVARLYRIDDNLRPAYEKAIDSIDSDYYRGAAQAALRRSMAR